MRSAAALVLGLLVAAALPARAATVTFNVDDAAEAPDTNTADGVCHTASNTCSLLAALQQATAPSANTFVINLKAATYGVSATLPTINTRSRSRAPTPRPGTSSPPVPDTPCCSTSSWAAT